jgi:hypothetical protein
MFASKVGARAHNGCRAIKKKYNMIFGQWGVRTETYKSTQQPELPGVKPRARGILTSDSNLGTS